VRRTTTVGSVSTVTLSAVVAAAVVASAVVTLVLTVEGSAVTMVKSSRTDAAVTVRVTASHVAPAAEGWGWG